MKKIFVWVIAFCFLFISPSLCWWNDSWQYRRPITINNTANSNLTDYQVLVKVDTATLINEGKLRSDCGDIRFVDGTDETELSYWIESGCNTTNTTIWVKVPSIPANSSVEIWMYYGNSELKSASDGHAVFEQFDDFSYTVRWAQEYANNPIVTAPAGYEGARYPCVIYDADEGKYKMWYTVHDFSTPYIMTIWYAESEDGLNWTNHQKVFEGTGVEGDFDNASVLCGTVIKDGDIYRMWYIGRPVAGCGSSENYGIGYAESTDGIHWERSPNNPLLRAGDFGCTFISGGAVIKDDKYRMVIQTDKRGHLELYKGVSDYPDKNWSFEADPFITNPVSETYEVNEPRLLKLKDTYYVIYPYDRTGGCGFTLTYAKSTDWINWDTYVATLLDYGGSADTIRHFPGILVPNFHGGNYVLDEETANLYIYWSYVTTSECDDGGDFKISVAFFDNFPRGLKYWEKIGGAAKVVVENGWMKIYGSNAAAAIKHIKNPAPQDNIAIEFDWYYPDEATDYKEVTTIFRRGETNDHRAKYNVAGYGKTDVWMFENGLTGSEVSCPTEPNTVYRLKFLRYNGVVKCFVNGCEADASYDVAEQAGEILLYIVDQNSFGHFIDNYRLRKYVEPEPLVSIGAEEMHHRRYVTIGGAKPVPPVRAYYALSFTIAPEPVTIYIYNSEGKLVKNLENVSGLVHIYLPEDDYVAMVIAKRKVGIYKVTLDRPVTLAITPQTLLLYRINKTSDGIITQRYTSTSILLFIIAVAIFIGLLFVKEGYRRKEQKH